jgi:hypothetical protein
MRCYCCDRNLNNYESTLRSAQTGKFLDMCKSCLKDTGIEVLSNKHNADEALPEDEHFWDMEEVELIPFNVEDDE